MVWLVYDLALDPAANQYRLTLGRKVYTRFQEVLNRIVAPEPGPMDEFVQLLQDKLDRRLDGDENPPDAPLLTDLL